MTRPERGDEVELVIDSLAFGGEGVARLGEEGYVVFVAGAIPGDRVRAVVYKRKRSYAHARAIEVLQPSPERIPPVADHPGVPWQVLPYQRQLEVKRGQIDEALRRIGHLDGYELQEIVPALEQWRYRNKLEYSFGMSEDGELQVAFTPRRAGGSSRRSRTACWRPSRATRRASWRWDGVASRAFTPGSAAAHARTVTSGSALPRTGARGCATSSCARAGAPTGCRSGS